MRAFLLLLPVLMFGQTKFNQIRIITSMDGTAPGQIEFDTSRADNKSVVLKAPTTATAGYTLTLPIAAPATTGDCLTGTTGGVLSFGSCAVGGYWTLSGADIYRLTGNVGIGLTSPATQLHLLTSSGTIAPIVRLDNQSFAGSEGGAIDFAYGQTQPVGARIQAINDGAAGANLTMWTKTGAASALSERMRIDSAGNVGIGTTGPGFRLSVAQDMSMGGDLTDGTAQMVIQGATTSGKKLLLGYDTTGNGFGFIKAGNQGVTWTVLALQPNGGNVGIGLTNPAYRLDVSGTLNATGAATLGAGLAVTGDLSFTGTLNTAISTTELGYLDGVTSAIQTQFSARALTSTQIFTTSPITGGGDLSANRTFACASCATTDTTQTISGSKTFSGALTMGANLLANSASAFDIGDATNYFQTIYAENGDFTNGAVANQYLKARKLEVADIAGSSGFWDHRSQASFVSNSSYTIRDNGGSRWLAASRAVFGSPTNSTTVFTDWVPALRSTGSGDAVSDSTLPALGATGSRWSTAFVNLLDATASLSLYPSGSVFLGALGNDWNRLWVGGVEATSFVRPQTDNGGTSGTAVKRWSTTYTNNLKADGTINLGTSSTVGYVWKATDAVGTGGWAADASQWTTSGSDIYYNTGNVGIGTASPGFKLEIVSGTNNGIHLKDAASATVFGGLFTQAAQLALITRSNHALAFGTNDATRVTIDNAGLVGIGTTSPATQLHLLTSSGTIAPIVRLDNQSFAGSEGGAIDFAYGQTQPVGARIQAINDGAAGANLTMWTKTGAASALSERMRIDSAGNVGIGTTGPGFRLSVAQDMSMGGDLTDGTAQMVIQGATTSGKKLLLGYDTTGNGFGFIKAGNQGVTWTVLALQPNGGNVGIGLTNPAYRLDVSGTLNATGAATLGSTLVVAGAVKLSSLPGIYKVLTSDAAGNATWQDTSACATCVTTGPASVSIAGVKTFTGVLTGTAGGSITGGNTIVENIRFALASTYAIGTTSNRASNVFTEALSVYGNQFIKSTGGLYTDAGSTVDFSGTILTGGSATYSGTTSCGSLQAVKTITVSRGLVTAVTCGTP